MEKNNIDGTLIVVLSRSLQKIHHKSDKLFHQRGLTMAQFAVLEALLHKGDCTIGELIAATLTTSGNMTVVIRNLKKHGLIKRISNPKDKRSFLITLSDDGRELINDVFSKHMELVREALSFISMEEKDCVINILKKLKIS